MELSEITQVNKMLADYIGLPPKYYYALKHQETGNIWFTDVEQWKVILELEKTERTNPNSPYCNSDIVPVEYYIRFDQSISEMSKVIKKVREDYSIGLILNRNENIFSVYKDGKEIISKTAKVGCEMELIFSVIIQLVQGLQPIQ